jgi:uncharacterized protein
VPAPPSPFTLAFTTVRGEAAVTARRYRVASRERIAWILLAHGAGAGQDSPFMVATARALVARGVEVVTFDFPYIGRGRRPPDPKATLEACCLAGIERVRRLAGGDPLFVGGKSMGGRIVTQVAASGDPRARGIAGLVLLGYPLHVPGRADQPRTAHWPGIRVPALFVQGTRDPFATPRELRTALRSFGAPARVQLVKGGDHSLAVRGAPAEAFAKVVDGIVAWMAARVSSPAGSRGSGPQGVPDGRPRRPRAPGNAT